MQSFNHIMKVISLLSPREKRRLLLVMVSSVAIALVEVVGVGTIMPFVAVASQPSIIHTNEYMSIAYDTMGFKSDKAFLIVLGGIMLAFVVLQNAGKAFLEYIKIRFTSMRQYSLSYSLLKTYLGQNYSFFLNRNSYEFIKNINSEIEQMISGTLIQLVDFISFLIQVLMLIAFLFIINPFSTLCIAVVIVFVYGAIYFFIRRTLKKLGTERFELNVERNRIVSEAFWGIKEVKIMGIENSFLKSFIKPSKRLARNTSTQEVISDIPKYVLETVAFGSVILFLLLIIIKSGNFQNAAATVSLYAYAGYRLMPAVQSLFRSISKMKYSAPGVDRMMEEFRNRENAKPIPETQPERMPFTRSIDIDALTFSYPSSEKPVLRDINLRIEANTLVGFAGKTGSGKTTLVDIILGLLWAQEGAIKVDGVPIDQTSVGSWQKNFGYVPQNIYLSNDTIAANIAFGVPPDQIDMGAVRNAGKLAQIDDFITEDLSLGYLTKIGERGISLSGGQRQRIGIARALYRNPPILVMDEATSALDNQTEQAVMDAIDGLSGRKTILLIAHRLTTLKKCDMIFRLEKGRIVEQGTYDEVLGEK